MNSLSQLPIRHWPSCILHLDADGFFASVEQALDPKLKGKPVVTGAERGMVIASSYEAKRYGVKTGMRLSEARILCPSLICVAGNYETYCLFSKRIFDIMRRFTPAVEEYSIDEAFADLSGLRRLHRASYAEISQRIKLTVEQELGITVSVGLSLTKSLAKLASKFRKPSGFVVVPGCDITQLLQNTPLRKVWGFGSNKVALLEKLGLQTAYDFVAKPEIWAKKYLDKPGLEIHRELAGQVVWQVNSQAKQSYASISKTKTFNPPSLDSDFIYAQALANLEKACFKARRFDLSARHLSLFLKRQNFSFDSIEQKLPSPTSNPLEISLLFKDLFKSVYKKNTLYRASGVVLGDLVVVQHRQLSFFEEPNRCIKQDLLIKSIDDINARFGRGKVHLAESLPSTNKLNRGKANSFNLVLLK